MSIQTNRKKGRKMSKKVIQKAPDAAIDSVISKMFMNGGSQAIRIPAAMRVETEQVRISCDPVTRIITIEPMNREAMKAAFIAMVKSLTEEERAEIKAMEFEKDLSVPTINPYVAEFFRDSE
jgi:virulence-associated protein VagC